MNHQDNLQASALRECFVSFASKLIQMQNVMDAAADLLRISSRDPDGLSVAFDEVPDGSARDVVAAYYAKQPGTITIDVSSYDVPHELCAASVRINEMGK